MTNIFTRIMKKHCIKISPNDIAFDFDGVIGDSLSAMLRYIKKNADDKDAIKYENITTYMLKNCFRDVGEDVIEESVRRINYNFKLVKPIYGALDALTKIATKSDIFVVTARPTPDTVIDWFDHFATPLLKNLHVLAETGYSGKAKILKKFDKNYFVEDRIETCYIINKEGINPIVFDHPWNAGKGRNFIRVYGWGDILKLLNF